MPDIHPISFIKDKLLSTIRLSKSSIPVPAKNGGPVKDGFLSCDILLKLLMTES